MDFQGGTPKLEDKTWISTGINAKKWKIPGESTVNLTGNPEGQFQKNRYPQQGTIFFGKAHSMSLFTTILVKKKEDGTLF